MRKAPILILLGVMALPLAGQRALWYRQGNVQVREVQGEIALAAPARVVVVARLGTLVVRGQEGNTLGYTLTLRAPAASPAAAALGAWPVEIARQGNVVHFETGVPALGVGGDLTLEVRVPRQVQGVEAATAVGSIRLDRLSMPLEVYTQAGNINAGALASPRLVAISRSGDITVERGQAVEARTSGSIHIGEAEGPVVLATTGGEITLGRAAEQVRINSDGGGIDIGEADGPVVAYSDGGNIHLRAAAAMAELHTGDGNIVVDSAHQLQCATGSGDIRLLQLLGGVQALTRGGQIEAVFAPQAKLANSELVAQRGALLVRLPSSVGAEVWAEIRSPEGHQIHSDYAGLEPRAASMGLVQARAPLNGGGPALRLLSVSSDITIHRP